MRELRYTLLSDGSSDRALLPLITWMLRQYVVECAIQAQWADLGRLPRPPQGLVERITSSVELYPCDLLCVHRDAEGFARDVRAKEIRSALQHVSVEPRVPAVCVVPVRMQEAWLLFDELALRRAAGNPNGRESLDLPRIHELEGLPDPKQILSELLRVASGLHGRRRSRLPAAERVSRLAVLIDDFSPLRALPAFSALEEEVVEFVHTHGWC